jgi:hypothetical protein
MTLELFNKNAIIFPDEIDSNGKIKYDLTKINNLQNLETLLNTVLTTEILNNIDCFITIKTENDTGFILTIGKMFNKDVLYIDPKSGFPMYGNKKLNYKLKYALWIDTVGYNRELFQGIEKLAKRGLRINDIFTLIDCHEGVSLFIEEVMSKALYKPIYELYNLMSIYESKGLIANFLVEKCKFNADKNRKYTHSYIETFTKIKNESYDYMKTSNKWYINNYLKFNNLLDPREIKPDYNNIILKYIESCKWSDIRNDIICYGNKINKLVIYPNNITDIDLEELYKLQKEYMFNVIEYNPYFKLMDTRCLDLYKTSKNKEIKTIFDGIIYSINISNLENITFKNDLIKELSKFTKKVLLYVNVVNNFDIKLLQDIILYSVEYMNCCIQGVIFDYQQVKNITYDKKLHLADLVPIILNINEITIDMKNHFTDNKYTSLMLSMHTIPLERRGFTWFIPFLRNNQEELNKMINERENRDELNKYIANHNYALKAQINNSQVEKMDSIETHSKIKLLSYISPFAWYNYLTGNK